MDDNADLDISVAGRSSTCLTVFLQKEYGRTLCRGRLEAIQAL